MSPLGLTVRKTALVIALCLLAAPAAAAPEILVLDLRDDPFAGPQGAVLFEEGPGAGAFVHDPSVPPAYPGDRRGSLAAVYDSLEPTSRASAPLNGLFTEEDDFFFGAVLTVRSDGYAPDPFGFHPVTFSLTNRLTTGFDRTGDLSDFRADTFDSLDFAWFPQVSPLFGGPFLSPGVFGSAAGDDAFASFAFASAEVDIPRDVPHLITLEHIADDDELIVTLYSVTRGGRPVPVDGGRLAVDLSGLAGFAVDTLSVTAYHDGFNIFSSSGRSLYAVVDYHRLFFGEGRLRSLRSLLGRGGGRVSPGATATEGEEGRGGEAKRLVLRGGEDGPERPRP